jgi:rod shape-determining protein MreB
MISKDIAIDLGTASVLVYVKGKGIVIHEPSVVAIEKSTGNVLKIGKEAAQMLGRTPANITTVRPLRDGVICQYDITHQMLQHFIRRACGTASIFKPRVMICVPSGITEVQERAVLEASAQAGAKRTYLIEEPVAAAIGAGIDISMPNGNMIVDIGGGTTDIAVIALNGIVVSKSIKVAGDKCNEAIKRYVQLKHGVKIGDRTAEEIKIRIGCIWNFPNGPKFMNVKGRRVKDGLPTQIQLSSDEMIEALVDPVKAILEAICWVIERTPPELVSDIVHNGIVMTGGGSMLSGLDIMISRVTGIKATVANKPLSCVAMGTGKMLDRLSELPEAR